MQYINNTTNPNFKGIYIIKGTGRKVAQATSLICERCSNPSIQSYIENSAKSQGKKYIPPKFISDFTDVCFKYLTGYFHETQPLVESLIATNEHTEIIDEYYTNVHDLGFLDGQNELNEELTEQIKKILAKESINYNIDLSDFEYSREECLNNANPKPLTDFILKKAIEAKNTLDKMLKPFFISKEEIRILNADNVINAIANNMFNFIEGAFKE